MSDKVKIISLFRQKLYKNFFPEVKVAAEENYFLQFNAYMVYLPSVSPKISKLNIFEIAVLKLLKISPFSLEFLSDKICLEIDLVKIICDRLFEMQLTDKHRRITDAGKNLLDGQTKNFSKKNILPYLILVSRDKGEIFPQLFSREVCRSEIIFGTTILQANQKQRCIFVNQKIKPAAEISQKILREAVENFNKINQNKIFIEPDFKIASVYSEPIFLHIKTVLQKNSDKFFLASCGGNFNEDFLNHYIFRNQSNVLENLKWRVFRR